MAGPNNGSALALSREEILQALCLLGQSLQNLQQGDPRRHPPLNADLYWLPLDSTPVVILAGAVYDVAFPRVPQRARGVISKIGVNVTGGGAGISAVTTQVLVNGIAAPIFRNGPLVGVVGALADPLEGPWAELIANDLAVIRCTNTDVGPQNIGIRAVGWHWYPEDLQ